MNTNFFGRKGWWLLLTIPGLALLAYFALGTAAARPANLPVSSPGSGGSRADVAVPVTPCGSLSFAPPVTYTVGTRPRSANSGDFNLDNHADMVVTNYSGNNISVLLGNADGTFQPSVNYAVGVHPVSVAVADFNEDTKPDLIVANYDSADVSLLLGNGNGTFQAAASFSSNIGPYGVTAGIFSEDGHVDVATSNVNFGTINVMLGNGNGTLQGPTQYTAGLRPQVIATADFNGDTHFDLVVPNYTASTVSVFLGSGNGTFQAAVTYPVPDGPDFITIADLNNDTHPDLLTPHYSGNIVSVLLGNANGSFQAAVSYPTNGQNPLFLAVADFSGDGKLDVAAADYGSDDIAILRGNGDGTLQAAVNFPVEAGSSPVAVVAGDFNNDTRLDMFVANENIFVGAVFLSNCQPPVGTATVTPVQSTPTASNTPQAATSTPVVTSTNTQVAATSTRTSTAVPPSATSTTIPPATETSTSVPPVTATACAISFSDVPADSAFYPYVRCLVCRGIISGYADGTFRPGNDITRGQIAKMVSNAAGFDDDPGPQIFEDVDDTNTFYDWINRLSNLGYMGGYPCGTVAEEPCNPPEDRPYFRPFANATRGQLAKIVANAAGLVGSPTGVFYTDVQEDNPFYTWIMRLTDLSVMGGYDCGGPGEPCDSENRPYFRPFNNVTRGQASKIVANTFLPDCETPSR